MTKNLDKKIFKSLLIEAFDEDKTLMKNLLIEALKEDKQLLKEAIIAVLKEEKREGIPDSELQNLINENFKRYGEIYKALA
jgi:hypothetical protein